MKTDFSVNLAYVALSLEIDGLIFWILTKLWLGFGAPALDTLSFGHRRNRSYLPQAVSVRGMFRASIISTPWSVQIEQTNVKWDVPSTHCHLVDIWIE